MTNRLEGRRVFLAEDDKGLAIRVERLIASEGASVTCASSPDAAQKVLDEEGKSFHVAVLDLMLPKDEDALQNVLRCELELTDLRKKLMDPAIKSDEQKELRVKRNVLLQYIDSQIEVEAGLTVAKLAARRDIPIVFLSAVGNAEVRERAQAEFLGSGWLVKPVSGEVLIAALLRAMSDATK